MPNDVSPQPPQPAQLFSQLKFWLAQRIPKRSELSRKLTSNGAALVALEKHADYCLVDPAAKHLPTGQTCYDYQYVDDSLQANQLQDPNAYRVQLPAPADRPVGSRTLGGKSSRTRFTPQDDQLLYNWIVPFRDNGGRWKGNDVYQQLARKYPQHTYQSWRSRFIDHVQYKSLTVTEDVNAFVEIAGTRAEGDAQRPLKRRRTNASRPADTPVPASPTPPRLRWQAPTLSPAAPAIIRQPSVPGTPDQSRVGASLGYDGHPDPRRQEPMREPLSSTANLETPSGTHYEAATSAMEDIDLTPRDAERQSLSVRAWRSMKSVFPNFTWTEANRLYKAVPWIYTTAAERRHSCFQDMAMAELWDKHSAEEWEQYYDEAILPEYIRRNGLKDDEEIEAFIEDARAREGAKRETPEIKREPSPDPRNAAERQRHRELNRARAETEEIAFSDASQTSQRQVDAFAANEEIPFIKHRPSPAVGLRSPMRCATGVHANEGRKRASQQTNSTQSESQPAQTSQRSVVSPKKKIFGPTTSLSPTGTQAGPETESGSAKLRPSSALQHLSAAEVVNEITVTSSLSSVLTAQKPPQSYQHPSKSASISQESAQYDTTEQPQIPLDIRANAGMTTVEKHVQPRIRSSSPSEDNPDLDLLSDGEVDNDEVHSQGALSDTGSEFMAFDTAPERSQLWETAADNVGELEDQEIGSDEGGTEGESDGTDADVAEPQNTGIIRRPPTPIQQKMSSEGIGDDDDDEGVENESDAYSTQHEGAAVNSIAAHRVETQALFERAENEMSEFDLPPPEGGWEALGLEDVNDEDPDQPITTVELPDDHPLNRRLSPAASQTTESSSEPGDKYSSPIVVPFAQEIHEISSDETQSTADGEEEEESLAAAPSLLAQSPPRSESSRSASLVSGTTTSSHATKSTRQSSDLAGSDGLADRRTMQNWVESQRKQYEHLPQQVFRRLASTAAASTILNITSATMLLRTLVEAFTASEKTRRLEHDRLQSLERHRRLQPQPFKSKLTLSDVEAKALLPHDVMGVWTHEDDEDLLSRTSASIGRVEKKHTKSGVKKRAWFFQNRYGLVKNTDGSDSAGPSTSGARPPVPS